jgi:hypothetical protein
MIVSPPWIGLDGASLRRPSRDQARLSKIGLATVNFRSSDTAAEPSRLHERKSATKEYWKGPRALIVGLVWAVSTIFIVSSACAATYNGTGSVYLLRSHDAAIGLDWFSLVGVTSLGACKTADGGFVAIRIKDDSRGSRHFAIVLSAKLSGIPITAWVDDTNVDSAGYCYVQFLQ